MLLISAVCTTSISPSLSSPFGLSSANRGSCALFHCCYSFVFLTFSKAYFYFSTTVSFFFPPSIFDRPAKHENGQLVCFGYDSVTLPLAQILPGHLFLGRRWYMINSKGLLDEFQPYAVDDDSDELSGL